MAGVSGVGGRAGGIVMPSASEVNAFGKAGFRSELGDSVAKKFEEAKESDRKAAEGMAREAKQVADEFGRTSPAGKTVSVPTQQAESVPPSPHHNFTNKVQSTEGYAAVGSSTTQGSESATEAVVSQQVAAQAVAGRVPPPFATGECVPLEFAPKRVAANTATCLRDQGMKVSPEQEAAMAAHIGADYAKMGGVPGGEAAAQAAISSSMGAIGGVFSGAAGAVAGGIGGLVMGGLPGMVMGGLGGGAVGAFLGALVRPNPGFSYLPQMAGNPVMMGMAGATARLGMFGSMMTPGFGGVLHALTGMEAQIRGTIRTVASRVNDAEMMHDINNPNLQIEDLLARFMIKLCSRYENDLRDKMQEAEMARQREKSEEDGKKGGGLLGGLLGFAIAGPAGAILGPSIGSGLGGAMANPGNLFGQQQKSATALAAEVQILVEKWKRGFELCSNVMKALHDMAMTAINNTRA